MRSGRMTGPTQPKHRSVYSFHSADNPVGEVPLFSSFLCPHSLVPLLVPVPVGSSRKTRSQMCVAQIVAQVAGVVLLALATWACSAAIGEERGRALTQDEIKAGQFTLKSARLTATLMVPDQPSSVYGGQRFESGGVVLQVSLDGQHTFLGKEPRGERLGGFGLIEEMGISKAVGYEDAKEGEPFLKLGVGLLQRPQRPDYFFFPPFAEVERFPWDVAVAAKAATFVQVGKPFRGTAYRYEKRVVLDDKEATLRIEHVLANTGEKPLVSDQYCHDFFAFDGAAPGPDYVVTTGFPTEAEAKPSPPMVAGERTVTFSEAVKGGVYGRFRGDPPDARSHHFTTRHRGNGLEAIVAGDFRCAVFACYADARAVSPEAYAALDVKPGETFRWTRTYAFRAHSPERQ